MIWMTVSRAVGAAELAAPPQARGRGAMLSAAHIPGAVWTCHWYVNASLPAATMAKCAEEMGQLMAGAG